MFCFLSFISLRTKIFTQLFFVQSEEWEEKRLENEKIANDALKEKVKRANEEKERKMQAYKEKSNITAVSEDKRLQASQDGLKDRQRQADEEKRKKLELYGQIAKQENETKTLATGGRVDNCMALACCLLLLPVPASWMVI